jgi:hypothetical protein
MSVCLTEDAYVRELLETRVGWEVGLSDGSIAHCDDGRPGQTGSAWVRLGQYLRRTGLRAVSYHLRFRSHREQAAPDHQGAYFFRRGAALELGGETIRYVLAGHARGPRIHLQRWADPELIPFPEDERTSADAGDSLLPE